MNDKKYWNAFNLITEIPPLSFKKIYNHFQSLETAWQSDPGEFKKLGFDERFVEYFSVRRRKISPDEEWEKLEKENIKVVTIKDKKYPNLLKEIYDPPALIYTKGNFNDFNEITLAVVGTRKASIYGKQVVEEITSDLARSGIVIVSGLALGIDSLAHLATLKAKGRTIAVLGSGLDEKSIYPYSNRRLAREIEENGLLISEYPIGTLPLKHHFPARNRIISGTSQGVLVIEAPAQSGALITARYALEQNREVFAIPGSIYNQNSKGTNNLIKMGAKLVDQVQDIIEELNLDLTIATTKTETKPQSPIEEKILKYLSKEPIHIDELSKLTKVEANDLNSALALMEVRGVVKNLGGMNYVKS